ncbi:MAG: selenide, water dikinase SelD, partial [Haliea sp.]
QLQSLDILRGLVSDPWIMGRIAANHALSDLYASGGRPLFALAAATLPFSSPALQQRELLQLLAGALAEFEQVGCRLVGGHSLQGPELALGFAVTGEPVVADRLLPKRGLQPGDQLLLTKPLGTGTLFAAHMQLQADGRDLSAATDMMLQSNYTAARLALEHGATAATDVTGFGLCGHLLEMLRPGQYAELSLEALPALPGALASLGAGIHSSMHPANVRLADSTLAPDPRRDLLFDPQTSGGLLLGIAAGRAGALQQVLRAAGYASAAVIGEVGAGEGELVRCS